MFLFNQQPEQMTVHRGDQLRDAHTMALPFLSLQSCTSLEGNRQWMSELIGQFQK